MLTGDVIVYVVAGSKVKKEKDKKAAGVKKDAKKKDVKGTDQIMLVIMHPLAM